MKNDPTEQQKKDRDFISIMLSLFLQVPKIHIFVMLMVYVFFFRWDFHLWQLFVACLPSVGMIFSFMPTNWFVHYK